MQIQSLSPDVVVNTYMVMLGRAPENDEVIRQHLEQSRTPANLVRNIAISDEFCKRAGVVRDNEKPSPFFHFNTVADVDVASIVRAHTREDRTASPGYLTNFLNVKIPPKVLSIIEHRGGQLDAVPIPANFHADMAEWAAALRAVDLSGHLFTMIELGCGWGCWMNNTGAAASALGKEISLIGVEGDELHIEYAKSTFAANNITPGQYSIVRGIAAADEGFALFPRRTDHTDNWGYGPRFGVSKKEADEATAAGNYDSLAMVPMDSLIGNKRIDLVHMDIQGGEAELVAKSIDVLSERVAYIVIGTHSRSIEGRLMDTMFDAGWLLEIERPAIFDLPGGKVRITVDGVQGWRNPRLLPSN